MKTKSLILFVLCGLLSCKPQKAKIKLPPSEKKLVVTCFINPDDSLITATVRMSTPKFNSFGQKAVLEDDIQNAKVVISDGAKSASLVFDPVFFFYKTTAKQFPISNGKTYFLKVTTPDGKEVSGSTSVPYNRLSIGNLDIKKLKDNVTDLNFEVAITVNDIAGETNYIGIGIRTPILTKYGHGGPYSDDTTNHGNTRLNFFDDDEKTSKTNYFTTSSASYENSFDTITYAAVNVAVINCSKEFYLYNRSVSQAEFTGQNPFSDPVLVYTNMSNGFGCFGAYRGTYAYRRVR